MKNGETLWVVIPAFREEATVGAVVGRLLPLYPNIVVVDDGSGDRTAAAAAAAGAEVVRHTVNLGQGASLQTGITYALSRGAAFVVTFDADGQHQPEDIAQLVETQERTGCDVVLGSRFLGKTLDMPLQRRLILRAAIRFTQMTTGLNLTDAHNGLRLFTTSAARRLKITQNRMAHASEILEKIASLGLSYAEAPVTVHYTAYSRAKGQSSLDAANILLDLVTMRLSR